MPDIILVADDEELIRWSLCEHLEQEGYRAISASNGKEALEAVREHAPAAMLLDLKMPIMDGLSALRALRESDHDLPVVVITAHGGVDTAIEATRLGASGYLTKPFDLREASLAIERALSEHRMRHEVMYLRHKEKAGYGEMVGGAPSMQRVFDTLRRLESVDAPTVLIHGESGTGKDLVARAIHARGARRDKPFMAVDCSAIPENLIESELFGHEKGSFTDARATKRGLFEMATGGVLFLDEVGELPTPMQAKLLRALENRKIRRVGGLADIPIDVCIIAATNRVLRDDVKAGRFREDLYFRLHVVPIEVPPLRERREDIPLLVESMVERLSRSVGRHVKGVGGDAMAMLQAYRWPGNVRELRNVLERTLILLSEDIVRPDDLPPEVRYAASSSVSAGAGCPFLLPEAGVDLEAVERGLLEQALARTEGNQSAASRLLGISRYALRYRMEKYQLADGSG